MTENGYQKLTQQVTQHVNRIKRAKQEKHDILAYASYIGVLGLVFVLPLVGGAYLGRWLDSFSELYSVRWTISMIFLGIVVGFFNVYFLIKE